MWWQSAQAATLTALCRANSAVGEAAHCETLGQSVFLRDSGFCLQRYPLAPVTNPLTQAEQEYSGAHTCNIEERTIGWWKQSYRLPRSVLYFTPKCCAETCCTVLQLVQVYTWQRKTSTGNPII